MISFGNDKLATKFLTKDEIRSIAPKVFCPRPTNPNVSARYVYAGTEKVIDDLAALGWYPVDAKQQKMRKEFLPHRGFSESQCLHPSHRLC